MKPFKITSQVQLGRSGDGRFTKQLVAAAPPQVLDLTIDKGVRLNEAVNTSRVPDRAVGDGPKKDVAGPNARVPSPVYPDSLPWPKAGPVNDANRRPFKA